MSIPILQWPDKDPDAVLDYRLDWTKWLGADTISTSTWTIAPDAVLVKNSDTKDSTGATVWLAGGTVGVTYELTNHITTGAGRTEDQSVMLRITVK